MKRPQLPTRLKIDRYHVLAIVVLAAVFLLYRRFIAAYLINDDEEGYLYAAWRISAGQVPYRDFLTPQLPAFLYPGALLMALFGRSTEVLRTWSALLVTLAGAATYLTGRRLFGPLAGLAAIAIFLLQSDIFTVARAFRPEATMLAMGALAVYLFVRADTATPSSGSAKAAAATSRGEANAGTDSSHRAGTPTSSISHADAATLRPSRSGYALASLCFGLASLAKLFGALPWAATAAYLLFDALAGGRDKKRAVGDLTALLLPGALLVAGIMGTFFLLSADTYADVVGHHLRQGATLTRDEVFRKGLEFYWDGVNWHMALLALIPAGLLALRRLAPRRGLVIAWQLPTLVIFLFMSRELWARHLIYLIPGVALIVGAAVSWAAGQPWQDRRLATLFLGGLVLSLAGPFYLDDIDGIDRDDLGTPRLARMIDTLVPADARILADYAGIAFYANRLTTKTAAGLSEGATESGQITGKMLMDEMTTQNVAMVLIDDVSQNGQLKDMQDYEAFRAKVLADYLPIGQFFRRQQLLSVFLRKDVPTLGIDYGWAVLMGLRLQADQTAAGEAIELTPIWHTNDPAGKRYTAFLHLVGPDGRTWAQGDSLLDNAIQRATEEWSPGELVATPLRLAIEPGTPPGTYHMQFGLYNRETGERYRWSRPDGTGGEVYDAGAIQVTAPTRPPDARRLDFGTLSPAADQPTTVGAFQLLALDLPPHARAGQPLEVRTTWLATRAPGPDVRFALTLQGPDGSPLGTTTLDPATPDWPTAAWRAGEVVTLRSPFAVDPSAPSATATLLAQWLGPPSDSGDSAPLGEPLGLGPLAVEALPPPVTQPPTLAQPLTATLGEHVALLGSDVPLSLTLTAGTPLTFTLYWRTDAVLPKPYTILVHLVDAAGTVVAQADGQPVLGDRPATSWRPGEVIADPHVLPTPGDLKPGSYRLLVGLYDAGDPAYPRLAAVVEGKVVEDGRVMVGGVEVVAGGD